MAATETTSGRAEGNIQGVVETCRDFGASIDEATARIAKKFNLSEDDARAAVERYWDVDVAM